MRLILHAFEHTPLLNNVEEEFGNRSSFESQRVRVQANMADLNSAVAEEVVVVVEGIVIRTWV